MAWNNNLLVKSWLTDADLSSSPYRVVKLASGKVALEAAGTACPFGITTENVADGSSTEVEVSVAHVGIAKVKVGAGGVTEGALVMGTTGGAVIDATTAKYHIGYALQTGTAGDIIEVLIAIGQLD